MAEDKENQWVEENPELNGDAIGLDPTSGQNLGTRIETLCEMVGWDAAAAASGKSVKQMRRYVHGADPPFGVLRGLAAKAGVSIEWLVARAVTQVSDCDAEHRLLMKELSRVRRLMQTEAKTPAHIEQLKELELLHKKLLSINEERRRIFSKSTLGRGHVPVPPEGRTDGAATGSDVRDEDLMALLVDGIMAVYKEESVGLPPRDLGRLAERMRADLVEAYDDPDERRIAVKGMLAQLRRDLREAPIGAESKRQA